MIWLAKEFGYAEWFSVQEKFEEVYMGAGAPKGMMLVSADTDPMKRTTLFMRLPDRKLATLFEGFSEIDHPPSRPAFLVGKQFEMEAQFPRREG